MTPPGSAPDFKTRDASSYDPVVDSFDRLAARFCAPFAERLVTLSDVHRAQRILDVGTGTGIVALRAGHQNQHSHVTGIDLSEGMLQRARTKAGEAGLHHVTFRTMDAEALDFPDSTFDVVLSLFALTHCPDPLRALTEMHRVLRPGGRLVLGVGGGPLLLSRAGLGAGARLVQRRFVEWRGKQLTAPHLMDALTTKYLGTIDEPEETAWAGRKRSRAVIVRRLVREAGFRQMSCDWLERRVVVDTAEEFWEIQATWSSITRKRIREAAAGQVAAIREEFQRICARVLSHGGRLVYPIAAFYTSAWKPADAHRG